MYSLPAHMTIDNIADIRDGILACDTMACGALDASALRDMTVPGIQLLLSLSKSLESRGQRLSLHGVQPEVEAVLMLCGLGEQLAGWRAEVAA